MFNKTIIEYSFRMIFMNYQNLVSVLSAEAETSVLIIHDIMLNLIQ